MRETFPWQSRRHIAEPARPRLVCQMVAGDGARGRKDIGRGRKLAGASGGQLIREDAESITGIPHQLVV